MKKYDVKRVAVVTSIGAGDSKDQAPFMFKMLMMTVMSSVSAWKLRVDGVGRPKVDFHTGPSSPTRTTRRPFLPMVVSAGTSNGASSGPED